MALPILAIGETMKLFTAETIIPRITAVTAIRDRYREVIGWSSRCDCGSREDHLLRLDGHLARMKAENHARNHNCRKNVTPWAGNLEVSHAR